MRSTYEDLRQRFIAGKEDVTATQLDKARREAEFEVLQDQAAEAAAVREASDRRGRLVAELEADVEQARTEGMAELQAAYRVIVDATQALAEGLAARRQTRAALAVRARDLEAHEVLSAVPELRTSQAYIERAVGDATGKRQVAVVPRADGLIWHTHELHDEEFIDPYRTDSGLERLARTRQEADRQQRLDQERADRQAQRAEHDRQTHDQRAVLGLL